MSKTVEISNIIKLFYLCSNCERINHIDNTFPKG